MRRFILSIFLLTMLASCFMEDYDGSNIPLAISIPNHRKSKEETQRIMMNIPTPKGKEAMENTQKRMISSQVTDTFPDADHRNEGDVKSPSEENFDQLQLINGVLDIIRSNDTKMAKAILALMVKDLKDKTRVNSEELYDNGHSRDIEFGYEETSYDRAQKSMQNGLIATSLRFSSQLFHVNWHDLISEELPLAPEHKISNLLHVCGKFSVNPLIVITKLLVDDKKSLRYLTQSDTDFNRHLASFSNSLSNQYQELSRQVTNKSSLEYLLKKMDKSESYVHDFTQNIGHLVKKYKLNEKHMMGKSLRNANNDIKLDLPFPVLECWSISGTHVGASQYDIDGNLVMSSLDFSPSLYQHWGVSFDYLNSEGHVHAAHSGRIKRHSDCSVEIEDLDSGYTTYYSHIVLQEDIKNDGIVSRGQLIGAISLNPDHSNCNCDWSDTDYECASGPHAHFELRRNGYPVSLNNRVISRYRIRAGKYSHDKYCSDPESCEMARNDSSLCATLFTDVKTGVIYCPTVKGQNLGGGFSYGPDGGHKVPGDGFSHLRDAIQRGPYSCTKSAGCLWKDYNNNTDWGYYDKANSNCEMCRDKCEKDSICKAFECGTTYCSWWAAGTCDDLRKANASITAHETCRILGIHTTATTTPSPTDEDLQKLDDLGVQIEMLMIAQNQSISKLNQLISILQKMINGTDSEIVDIPVELTDAQKETHLQTRGSSDEQHERTSCKPPGNPRCNRDTWHLYPPHFGYSDACCSEEEKCTENEGDCNRDSECRGSLICKHNSCPTSPEDDSKRFHERASCCQQPSGVYILDFDFEKLSNTNCTYEDEAFESLVTAKDKCRSNKQCAGVFQRNCSDDNNYYICLKNKTISSDFQIEGCLHYKFPIDPCDRIQCTATNTICEIIFATGTPNCVCPLGMKGDPKIGCEPDGTDFKKYDAFKCKNYLYTAENLVYAMMACREDDECSMISSNDCDNNTAEYQLCGQAPDIVSTDNDQACTYRKKIHGAWSEWQAWSDCSTSCEDSFRTRTRTCNNPEPKWGGDYCSSTNAESKRCDLPKCIIKQEYQGKLPNKGPLIEGTISVLPEALYSVQVEILQTDFGESSEYVDIILDQDGYGRCSPPATGSCEWYPCKLNKNELRAINSSATIHIQFSSEVEATRYCESQVEARITLVLKNPCGSCGSHAVCEYDVFGKANCKCPLIGDESDPSKKCKCSIAKEHGDGRKSGTCRLNEVCLPNGNCAIPLDCTNQEKEVTAAPGSIIISPNYPHHYDHNSNCGVILNFEENENIVMYFLSFDVSESSGCTQDYLEIRSLSSLHQHHDSTTTSTSISTQTSTSSAVRSLCGYGIPDPYNVNGNKVNLTFRSDSSLGFRGFEISIGDECKINGTMKGNGKMKGDCGIDGFCLSDGTCRGCTIDGLPGDGERQGTCSVGLICPSNGICSECINSSGCKDSTKSFCLSGVCMGLIHTTYGVDCRNHGDAYVNLFDENECRNSKALFANAHYIEAISSPKRPKGCFIDGPDFKENIYWNTSPNGVTDINIRSICKAGKNKGESCSSTFGACYGQCIDGLVCSSEQQCGKCVDPAVNGAWGLWSPPGGCIRTNKVCRRTRRRSCDNPPPSNGGAICVGPKIDSINCASNACGCVIDTLPTGLKAVCKARYSCPKLVRTRSCHKTYWHAMPKCRSQLKPWWRKQVVRSHCKKSCKYCRPVAIDCEWGSWSIEACTKTCGEGTRTKTRRVAVKETNGGTCVGSRRITEPCKNQNCPIG